MHVNYFYWIFPFLMLSIVAKGQNSSVTGIPSNNDNSIQIHAGATFSRATGTFVDAFKTDIEEQNETLGEAVNLNSEIPIDFGFAFGATYTHNLGEKISLSSGLGFWRTQLVTRVKYEYRNPDFSYDEVGTDQTTFKLSYMTLPLKASFHVNDRWTVEAGVHLNFTLKGQAEAVIQSGREVIINGDLDEEWTRPTEESTIALKDEVQSLVPQYRFDIVYDIGPFFNAAIGFFGNGKHLTIEGQDLTSLGLQFSLRADLGSIIKI